MIISFLMKKFIKKFSLFFQFKKNYPFFINQKVIRDSSIFQKYLTKSSFWFTLVELIVVITILAILGTIAFVSFNNYTVWARDSTRLADLATISKWLLIYRAKIDKYPLPDKSVKIYWSWELIWYQWEVWSTIANIINLSSIWWKDPLYQTNYTYTITSLFDKYQLLTFLEDKSSITLNFEIPQNIKIYATDYINKYPYVRWDTLWVIINYSTWSKNEPIYTPLQDTGTWINLESSTVNQKVIISNTSTLTWVTIEIKNNYIQTPSSVNWTCWTKAKTYERNEIAFSWSDTDCTTWNLSWTVTWPAIWATTTWNCNWFSWWTNATCTAIHSDKSCASNPVFANVWTLTTWSPTSSGQTWIYSATPTWNCTYTCLNWYSGNNCATPPPPYYPSLCDTPDIVVPPYTIAACNVGTTIAWTGFASYWVYFQWWEMYGWNTTVWTTTTNNTLFSNGLAISWSLNNWPATVSDSLSWWINRWWITWSIQWPCPSWRHIPTHDEWSGAILAWWYSDGSVMSEGLKLPITGYRLYSDGSFLFQDYGFYWSTSPSENRAYSLFFKTSISTNYPCYRTFGFNVRCFKN